MGFDKLHASHPSHKYDTARLMDRIMKHDEHSLAGTMLHCIPLNLASTHHRCAIVLEPHPTPAKILIAVFHTATERSKLLPPLPPMMVLAGSMVSFRGISTPAYSCVSLSRAVADMSRTNGAILLYFPNFGSRPRSPSICRGAHCPVSLHAVTPETMASNSMASQSDVVRLENCVCRN